MAGLWAGLQLAQADGTYWLDLLRGEEVTESALLDDLAKVQVVYVGETHTLERHHDTQRALLQALSERGRPLALGMEQIEARYQPVVDRFNAGELDFDGLAREMDWAKKWKNFEQYRALCELAQSRKIPLAGLNAPAEVIRAVGKSGLESLTPEQRKELPVEIDTKDPVYEKLLDRLLSVHMTMDPAKLRTVFEAQVARDETMAENVARLLNEKKVVMVVCGSGHVNYGLGTPDRVRRRAPEAADRILAVTESGELRLTPAEEAMRREISLSHEDLREIGRPLADYLQVKPRTPSP